MTNLSVGNANTQALIRIPPAPFFGKFRQSLASRIGLQKLADELNQDVANSLTAIRSLCPSYVSKSDCVRIEVGIGNVTNGLSVLMEHLADASTATVAGGVVGLACQIGIQASRPFHLDSLVEWVFPIASMVVVGAVWGMACRIPGRVNYSLATYGLLKLIRDIAADESAWTSIDNRANWTKRIDRIADCWIASKSQFAVPGKELDAETDRTFRAVAESLRSQRTLLVDASEQSRGDLLRYLTQFLGHALSGNWRALERSIVDRQQPRISQLTSIYTKPAILAIAPTVAVVSCHFLYPGLAVSLAIKAIATLFWPTFILMTVVAPDLKEKIELLKRCLELFAVGIDGKKE